VDKNDVIIFFRKDRLKKRASKVNIYHHPITPVKLVVDSSEIYDYIPERKRKLIIGGSCAVRDYKEEEDKNVNSERNKCFYVV
jgi:hypothetical protein